MGCAVITVSDTRSLADDSGGALVASLLEGAGHAVVARTLVPDDAAAIGAALDAALARADCAAVLLTGGTGVAPRDVTPEAVEPLFDRPLPGFGEVFRQLSFAEIGPAAILSRATAGVAVAEGGPAKAIFALPGSPAAVALALDRLVLPVAAHLLAQARRRPPDAG